MDELERKLDALERVIRLRPDWADGHWKLGLIYLRLYSTSALESLAEFEKDTETAAAQASPLWLFSTIHSPPEGKPILVKDLLEIDHIRLYLVPAARSFLEARRCSPLLPDPHARLASLDYLLEGANRPASMPIGRCRLAGSNLQVLELVQSVAIQIGDLDLLARCWKRILIMSPESAEAIAEVAGKLFTPQEILDRIIPSGEAALRFASRAYTTPRIGRPGNSCSVRPSRNWRATRSSRPANRFQAEAYTWFLLNDREQAESKMEAALTLNPKNAAVADPAHRMAARLGSSLRRLRSGHDRDLLLAQRQQVRARPTTARRVGRQDRAVISRHLILRPSSSAAPRGMMPDRLTPRDRPGKANRENR